MQPEVLAIITARGGSKGLPRKNLRLLAGRPLISYSIAAALECPGITRCIVSTEDHEIKQVSLRFGAEVLKRPGSLAEDHSLSRDVVRHVLETLQEAGQCPPYFALLQPTSPLRNARHLLQCLDSFFAGEFDSAISVIEAEHHPRKCLSVSEGGLQPLFDIADLDTPRQKLMPAYRQNGAIYIGQVRRFLLDNSFFLPPVMPFVMDRQSSIDIDSEFDLKLAEMLLQEAEE